MKVSMGKSSINGPLFSMAMLNNQRVSRWLIYWPYSHFHGISSIKDPAALSASVARQRRRRVRLDLRFFDMSVVFPSIFYPESGLFVTIFSGNHGHVHIRDFTHCWPLVCLFPTFEEPRLTSLKIKDVREWERLLPMAATCSATHFGIFRPMLYN